jgi:hypothetical protein
MSASLNRLRIGVYAYSQRQDPDSGVTASVYTRVLSRDPDGLWWASRGTNFGREAAPVNTPQEEETSFWTFRTEVPVHEDGVITLGTEVFRVLAVMPRQYFRGENQAFCVHVDDADPQYTLEEP